MNNILNDGYYVPKDPEILKRLVDNANFNYDQWAAERQSTIPTEEQFLKYRETKQIIDEVSRTLKVLPDQLVNKIENIKEEIESLNVELKIREIIKKISL